MLDVLLLFPQEFETTSVDAVLSKQLLPELQKAKSIRSLRVSQGTVMSRGGPSPYSRVVEASFDSLADWMTVVEALNTMRQPSERETFDRLAPLVVFFEASSQL